MPVMKGTIFCCLLCRMVMGWAGRKGSGEVESTMGQKGYSFFLPVVIGLSVIRLKSMSLQNNFKSIQIPTEVVQAFCTPAILTRSSYEFSPHFPPGPSESSSSMSPQLSAKNSVFWLMRSSQMSPPIIMEPENAMAE